MRSKAMIMILSIVIFLSICIVVVCGISLLKNKADNKINFQEVEKYANNEILKNDENDISDDRDIDNIVVLKDPEMYTYEDMEKDIEDICRVYDDKVTCVTIAETYDGRKVYDVIVGDIKSSNHVMVQGAIHAREYMTTQLVMKQLAELLKKSDSDEVVFSGMTVSELLNDSAIHIIPMVNPDGVSISQKGKDGIVNEATLETIKKIAANDGKSIEDSEYLRQWKSNAQGIDLNRNFDADWEKYKGPDMPSSDHYKGETVGCTAESAALIELTEKYPFRRTLSYHAQGQVIYWYFGQEGELLSDTENFAKKVSSMTGYYMDRNFEALDPAGYKDWAIIKKGIPSITVEVGKKKNPVPPEQFKEIWNQNKDILYLLLAEI